MEVLVILVACLSMLYSVRATSWIPRRNSTSPSKGVSPLAVNSTAPVVPSVDDSSNPQMGYAEFITSGGWVDHAIVPWPFRTNIKNVGQGFLHRIPYCFVDKRSYENLEEQKCLLKQGIKLWSDVIGAPGRDTGHSLAFRQPESPTDYCCKNYRYGLEYEPLDEDNDLQCDWNDKYPKDALAIHWADEVKAGGFAAKAFIGYLEESRSTSRIAGRHYMHITDYADAATVAHELGHVLGLVHEHQRWDRDDFIEFRCHNLYGMQHTVDAMMADTAAMGRPVTEAEAWDMLCNSEQTAYYYGAPTVALIKGAGLDVHGQPALDGPGDLDLDSIMMYPSYFGAIPPYDLESSVTLDTAVMVKIKKDKNGNKIPLSGEDWRIPRGETVSPKDAEFIKKFYAWDQAKADQYHWVPAAPRPANPGTGH